MRAFNLIFSLLLISNAYAVTKVGVLIPLTGPAAEGGRWIQQGLQVAAQEYPDIELVFEDDQCKGNVAISGYRKLVDEAKVSLILGPLCGTAFVPLAPIAEREGVVLVSLGLNSKRVLEAGTHSLSLLPAIGKSAEALVNFAQSKLSARSISILAGQDELSEDARLTTEQVANELGISIVSTQTFDRATQDFSPHLVRYQHQDSAALLVFAFPSDYINLVRQAKTLQLHKPLLFLPTFQSNTALKEFSSTQLRVYYSYPVSSTDGTEFFEHAYSQRFGIKPESFYPGAGYDALRFVADPLKQCRKDIRGCILEKLLKTKLDAGVNGPMSLDAEGNNSAAAPFEIRTVLDGQPRQWNN